MTSKLFMIKVKRNHGQMKIQKPSPKAGPVVYFCCSSSSLTVNFTQRLGEAGKRKVSCQRSKKKKSRNKQLSCLQGNFQNSQILTVEAWFFPCLQKANEHQRSNASSVEGILLIKCLEELKVRPEIVPTDCTVVFKGKSQKADCNHTVTALALFVICIEQWQGFVCDCGCHLDGSDSLQVPYPCVFIERSQRGQFFFAIQKKRLVSQGICHLADVLFLQAPLGKSLLFGYPKNNTDVSTTSSGVKLNK